MSTAHTMFAAILALCALTGAATPARERVIDGNGIVDSTIAGAAGRIRIEPSGTGMPLITTAFAERATLKSGMLSFSYAVGTERVHGRTGVGSIDLGTGPSKHRIGWTATPYTPAADGVVGPGGVSEDIVRFVLHPPVPGERMATLPMTDQGGLAGGWGELYALIDLGGQPLRIRFDPYHARTLATASAAVRIAAAQGGTLQGAVEKVEIAFGIERPVRTMTLARSLAIGPLQFATLGVRTGDYGSTAGLADAAAPIDPDEVVVTAKSKKPGRDRLSIGADLLARCSSIVFDKPAKQIRLTCG